MTQYILVQFSEQMHAPAGLVYFEITDGPAADAAREYFGDERAARLVVGWSGAAGPLVDAMSDAQQRGFDVARTRLGRFFEVLVRAGKPFVCWCGEGAFQLPVARSWAEVLSEAERQTAARAGLNLFYPGAL